jgi:hypothetical protein
MRLAAFPLCQPKEYDEISGTGFILWGVGLARTKTHRLKPVLLNPLCALRMEEKFLISFRAGQVARTNALDTQTSGQRSMARAINCAFV